RPVIMWQTQEQQIYEIEITGDTNYRTKTIPEALTREFKVPIYLDNGEYTARVRITNEYGLKSPWAEKSFTISVLKPDKPYITIYNSTFKVTISTDSNLPSYIYRDGDLIGDTVNGAYEDYTGESGRE